MTANGLDAAFTLRRGTFELDIELQVPASRVTAIVGPNGAGKSTALAALAGLLRPSSGRVALYDQTLDDTASGVHVPTTDRRIGVVFQSYLLFPHLTALENVAFGLRARRDRTVDARRAALDLLDRFGLAHLAAMRPAQLSGGQAQRVALARALAIRPQLLLLDEPLAALDAAIRPELRADLLRAVREYGGSTVLVTHDAVDAMTIADEIVVLEGGAVTHRSAPADLKKSARTAFVADLMGLNLVIRADGSEEIFAPEAVLVSPLEPPNGCAEPCIVRAVELGPAGIRLRLEKEVSPGFFWAAPGGPASTGGIPRVGDRVWAERWPAVS